MGVELKTGGYGIASNQCQERSISGQDLRGPGSIVYPWPVRSNIAVQRVERAARHWAQQFGLIDNSCVSQRFTALRIGELVAQTYPECAPDLLELIAQVMTWIFVEDDRYDTAPTAEQRPDRLESCFQGYLEILRSGEVSSSASPAERALQDFSQRLRERSSPSWYLNFIEVMRQFWIEGIVAETYYRARRISPDPGSYMAMRVQTVGVYICLALFELAADCELTPELRQDPILQRMSWLTSRIVAYVNDLYSYHKERRLGDVNNYLHVMGHCESMSLQIGVDHLVRVHNRELEQFCSLDGMTHDRGASARRLVECYVDGCRMWMIGALSWQRSSPRYASGRELLARQNNVEPMLTARSA